MSLIYYIFISHIKISNFLALYLLYISIGIFRHAQEAF